MGLFAECFKFSDPSVCGNQKSLKRTFFSFVNSLAGNATKNAENRDFYFKGNGNRGVWSNVTSLSFALIVGRNYLSQSFQCFYIHVVLYCLFSL